MMKDTVTTITMAKVIEAASSNCCMNMLTRAEQSSRMMSGFLNCSRYFFQTGSSVLAWNSLKPKVL